MNTANMVVKAPDYFCVAGNKVLEIDTDLQEYSIKEILGAGNFGITYKAWDNNLNFFVAIKEFFPDELAYRDSNQKVVVSSDEQQEFYDWALERFVSEAKTLAQFKHPNIVRVSRYFHANDTAYIVMDYEEGKDLGSYLRKIKLTDKLIREIFIPVLEGLNEVHSKQYLHRDVKPDNIYIRDNGSPILLDFGAAYLEIETGDNESVNALTPGYAPIEQYYHDGEQGPWSDIYALGATMYKSLFGKPPIEAIKRVASINENNLDPYNAAVTRGKEDVEADILEVIDWMLNVATTERPQSVRQVLKYLDGQRSFEKTGSFIYKPKNVATNFKLLVAGPMETEAVEALATLSAHHESACDLKAITVDEKKKHLKQADIALGYSNIKLSETENIHLYIPPVRQDFRFLRNILQEDAIGLILLINNDTEQPLQDTAEFLNMFKELIEKTGVALGIQRTFKKHSPSNKDYFSLVSSDEFSWCKKPPIFDVDPGSYDDLGLIIKSLFFSIDPGVNGSRV